MRQGNFWPLIAIVVAGGILAGFAGFNIAIGAGVGLAIGAGVVGAMESQKR